MKIKRNNRDKKVVLTLSEREFGVVFAAVKTAAKDTSRRRPYEYDHHYGVTLRSMTQLYKSLDRYRDKPA
jgi:hypothetical protein